MIPKMQAVLPEWSRKIEAFRHNLNVTQSEMGRKVGTSAMAISRWERGRAKPSADAYVRLGNLAGDPLCWFFWGQAGLSTADVMRVLPEAHRRLREGRIATVQVVHAGAGKRTCGQKPFAAVPLLPVRAATSAEDGDQVADLDQVKPEAMLAAPMDWCPNPASTLCFRVKGNSMSPLILDGYIIAVDTLDVSHDDLLGQIVVAQNSEKRLLVSRLVRFDHTDILVSDQYEGEPLSVAGISRWRIVGRVLWWIGRVR